jgi:primary-amine oxidase
MSVVPDLQCSCLLTPPPDHDDQLWPAGRHVPQTSGEPSTGLPEWIGDGEESIDNTDLVVWHTFGLVHMPAPEDFPVMPAEPMSLLLRPRNFFLNNPCLDVRPSHAVAPSQIAKGEVGTGEKDGTSVLAFGCCGNGANGTNGTNGA